MLNSIMWPTFDEPQVMSVLGNKWHSGAVVLALFLVLLALPGSVGAQQYQETPVKGMGLNPAAMGVQETGPLRYPWGSIASGKNDIVGWSYDARSKNEAEQLAVEACERAGGTKCKWRVTAQGRCAILAQGERQVAMRLSLKNEWLRRRARAAALRSCGPDCRILKEICSLRE